MVGLPTERRRSVVEQIEESYFKMTESRRRSHERASFVPKVGRFVRLLKHSVTKDTNHDEQSGGTLKS